MKITTTQDHQHLRETASRCHLWKSWSSAIKESGNFCNKTSTADLWTAEYLNSPNMSRTCPWGGERAVACDAVFPNTTEFLFFLRFSRFFMICWFLSESFSLYPCYSRFMFALFQIFFSYIIEIYLSIFSPYHLAFFCCLSVCIDEDLVTILSFSLRVSFIITHLFENWKK